FGENPFQLQVLSRAEDGVMKPVSHSERLLISGINVNSKNPLGRSLLDGLPFISSILLKIYGSIGTNWERIGNLRYAVTYHPGDSSEAAFATDRADEIAREWSAAMSESDSVRDFVAVGDIDIKVIGADNQVLDSQIPVKQMLEQIVAKLGLPPFVLGLSWSTTERMSQQQSDILTSELEYYRSVLEPTILKICNTFLQHDGYRGNVTLNWNDISLQDEVELANARLIRARAQQIEQTLGGAE
ncbi:MAG: serine/threonine protein phosphatase, partial [Oscillospiraceae bacterium]